MKSYTYVCLCFTLGGFVSGFFFFLLSFHLSVKDRELEVSTCVLTHMRYNWTPASCAALSLSTLLAFFQFLRQTVYLHIWLRTSRHALPCAGSSSLFSCSARMQPSWPPLHLSDPPAAHESGRTCWEVLSCGPSRKILHFVASFLMFQ